VKHDSLSLPRKKALALALRATFKPEVLGILVVFLVLVIIGVILASGNNFMRFSGGCLAGIMFKQN